uniref:Uncharacterized protein n=1 Tax=Candidatus Kentrum sp. DK TaxID=2126562 RepID=A0A450S0K3_9GAMM|nr:MAG: hypothetical protein BECKDK2373B_GA0170837_10098 [Candidatus Kentron sp. DK]VFJ54986.1 MAG: hypothetical protein BECKDK2373C_GA0170839_104617 [Candidatus Kentron sp. DK]
MSVACEINGTRFVWDKNKAKSNLAKHGVSFELAATAFFDPLLRFKDASRNGEGRDAVIGFSANEALLYVVHIEVNGEYIRIISARKATVKERKEYDP